MRSFQKLMEVGVEDLFPLPDCPLPYIQAPPGSLREFRLRMNGGSHTRREWLSLRAAYDQRCLRCSIKARPLTKDHIVPVACGGPDDISNIQPLCGPCNSRKGTKTIDYRPATKEARIIIYNGVEYPTLTAAAEAHGISRQAMAKRLAKEGK